MTTDLSSLLASGNYSDVVICVGSNRWKAHKNILTARCPVFGTMFECGLKEASQNVINLDDVTPEAFSLLINFIYSAKLGPDFDRHATELLAMGEKVGLSGIILSNEILTLSHSFKQYAMPELKSICEEALCDNITLKSVLDLLILSDTHECTRLKACVIDFIAA